MAWLGLRRPAATVVAGGRALASDRCRPVATHAPPVHVAHGLRARVLRHPAGLADRVRRVARRPGARRLARAPGDGGATAAGLRPHRRDRHPPRARNGGAGQRPDRGSRARRGRRLRRPRPGPRATRGAWPGPGVQRHERATRGDRRGPSPAARRRQPRAAHAAHRHAGHARGHARRAVPRRRGAPGAGARGDARARPPRRGSEDALVERGREPPPAPRADQHRAPSSATSPPRITRPPMRSASPWPWRRSTSCRCSRSTRHASARSSAT